MTLKREWKLTKKEEAIFNNLWHQVVAIIDFKSSQQGYRGTERYREGLRAFCKHLAKHYQPSNFRNLENKHLISFIKESLESCVSITTLKTDLSAIRKLHKLTRKTRYKLTVENDILGVEKRFKKEVDRAWADEEWNNAIKIAELMNRSDVVWALSLARTCGVRLEEGTALTKTQLKEALTQGFLSLRNTKNGILRDIPLDSKAKAVISRILKDAATERVFVYHGRNHQQAKKSIQNWITNNRSNFAETFSPNEEHLDLKKNDYVIKTNITFHGLRHSFAREKYREFISRGFSRQASRKHVAELLGHGRDYVTLIYLGPDAD